ncbi:Phospholipid/glycerol acyltransferase [Dillenia turbinata]|uniref:Glycerol-3-phosphate acyltransferase, chloroplastic n=1 Tax=Dillenia turbinata TaxID=194707 RepID=A0AAN8ZW52_9MAGN
MLILSSSTSFLTLRVSLSLSSTPFISSSSTASSFPLFLSCTPPVRSFSSVSSLRSRNNKGPCVVLYSSSSPMAEMVDDAVTVPSEDNNEENPCRSILDIDSEEGRGQVVCKILVSKSESYVGNISLFHEIEEKLNQGHNVVLFSNHQTEADPAVIALLLENTHARIAENMTYVAGDRVITDPLCKPFSMGRNLICVYSKKHMFDVPELADMKRKANIRSLKEMAVLLRGGSQIVWIAPSGGRDRPDPETGEWYPAPFDPSSVDNMTRLALHSGVPGHVFPLALLCYDIMPPPRQVEKEIGEKRLVSFCGVGLSVASEISFQEVAAAHEDPEKAKVAYQEALYNSVTEQYNVLKSAIYGKEGLAASTPSVSLSQPWV